MKKGLIVAGLGALFFPLFMMLGLPLMVVMALMMPNGEDGGEGGPGMAVGGELVPGDSSQIVAIAHKYLGVPYVWGGTNPAVGLDCSGLTQLVLKQVGVNVPRTADQQARSQLGRVVALHPAEWWAMAPGDIIAFRHPGRGRDYSHIGIYIGNQQMLHAPAPGKKVSIVGLNSGYYLSQDWLVKRYIE